MLVAKYDSSGKRPPNPSSPSGFEKRSWTDGASRNAVWVRQYHRERYIQDLGLDDLVVVAPDVGRVKLAEKFRDKIGADLAVLTKERPARQVAEISYVIGEVEGKTAVFVDEMIDTGGTLKAAAQTVRDAGPSASSSPPRTRSSRATPSRTS